LEGNPEILNAGHGSPNKALQRSWTHKVLARGRLLSSSIQSALARTTCRCAAVELGRYTACLGSLYPFRGASGLPRLTERALELIDLIIAITTLLVGMFFLIFGYSSSAEAVILSLTMIFIGSLLLIGWKTRTPKEKQARGPYSSWRTGRLGAGLAAIGGYLITLYPQRELKSVVIGAVLLVMGSGLIYLSTQSNRR
jgi:hypothetical protein